MDRVALFDDLLGDEATLFSIYMKRRRKWGGNVAFVFENDDEKYYCSAINIYFNNFESLSSGRRENSIELMNAILTNEQLKNDATYFFIDADFSYDLKTSTSAYVTSKHSIENYYCDSVAVRALIRSEAGLAKAKADKYDEDDILDEIMLFYDLAHSKLLNSKSFLKFNYLLYLYIVVGDALKLHLNDNLKLRSVFSFSDGYFYFEDFVVLKPKLQKVIEERVEGKSAEFYSYREYFKFFKKNPRFRGKQELEFLIDFIASCSSGGAIHSYIKEKYGCELKMLSNAGSNWISFWSQYAIKPPCLYSFLENVKSIESEKAIA